jgi:hypothetical protein
MDSIGFDLFLHAMPADERARLIALGRPYSSVDTLAQADLTLHALAAPGAAALLTAHGFGADDTEQLYPPWHAQRL